LRFIVIQGRVLIAMKKFTRVIVALIVCFLFITIHPKKIVEIHWINVLTFGNDSNAIQQALDIAKYEGNANIIIPDGNYNIYKTLIVYSNTHIIMGENTYLNRMFPGTLMENGKVGDNYQGYHGNGNIIIDGGTINGNVLYAPYGIYGYGGIGFAHANKLVIRNLTIKDIVYSHAIEINSSNNVLIENCKFLGYKDNTPNKSREFSEAIQIDFAAKSAFPDFGTWDFTPSKNVIIRNNYFGVSNTRGMSHWPVGVGGHGALNNVWIENVKIYHNTFQGMYFAAIRSYNWKKVFIKNNEFNNCKTPVLVNSLIDFKQKSLNKES